MKKVDAAKFLIEKLEEYGLRSKGWTGKFNSRTSKRLGQCQYDNKVIELGSFYVENNSEELVKDTILHEIAHALAGPGTGHGPVWKQWCLVVGAHPVARWKGPDVGLVQKPMKYRLAIKHPDGKIEPLQKLSNRRTCLAGRYLTKRPLEETLDKLVWIENK
ncbi:hypothetical protein KoPa4_00094 [Pseudomonas phage vB_PpuM-KoPa-4]|uniref:SprT-like domain-containing protein n=1 Tax=Pseudomonas phage vB_PpuM-KoPa-4 TaxID=3132618 RepID=A0AAX4MXW8_9CAUD